MGRVVLLRIRGVYLIYDNKWKASNSSDERQFIHSLE